MEVGHSKMNSCGFEKALILAISTGKKLGILLKTRGALRVSADHKLG